MPNLTKAQVEKLMEGATKGRWRAGRSDMQSSDFEGCLFTNVYSDDESKNPCIKHHVTGNMLPHTVAKVMDEAGNNKADAEFIAALPDIAKTALDALQRVERLEQKLNAILQFGNDVCLGCKREIDTTTCWCGDSINHGFDNHSAVPMGCDCGRVKSGPIESL